MTRQGSSGKCRRGRTAATSSFLLSSCHNPIGKHSAAPILHQSKSRPIHPQCPTLCHQRLPPATKTFLSLATGPASHNSSYQSPHPPDTLCIQLDLPFEAGENLPDKPTFFHLAPHTVPKMGMYVAESLGKLGRHTSVWASPQTH